MCAMNHVCVQLAVWFVVKQNEAMRLKLRGGDRRYYDIKGRIPLLVSLSVQHVVTRRDRPLL